MPHSLRQVNGNRVLERDGQFICSDTPIIRDYYRQHLSGFYGKALLTGLGLGVALEYVCSLPAVVEVDVVEIEPEVVNLLTNLPPKAHIFQKDAWLHEGEYDCCFHDIWTDFLHNKQEAKMMEAKFPSATQVSLPLTFA